MYILPEYMVPDHRTHYRQKLAHKLPLATHYKSYDFTVLPSKTVSRPNRSADLLLCLVYRLFHLSLRSDTYFTCRYVLTQMFHLSLSYDIDASLVAKL